MSGTTGSRRTFFIAVDFDGTIVTHKYPEIGDPIPGAMSVLRQLIRDGHKLILWSVREGALLDEAVDYCKEHGVTFYAVNRDYPEEQKGDEGFTRKLKADVFIDDRNIGGRLDWELVYKMISEGRPHVSPYSNVVLDRTQDEMMEKYRSKRRKKGFWSKVKRSLQG